MGTVEGTAANWPQSGLNAQVQPLVEDLLRNRDWLRIKTERTESGATLVDAGIDTLGGLEAGRRIAEICMAGLGRASISSSQPSDQWRWRIGVTTCDPVLVCLGSQYAGWMLSSEDDGGFFALGSGPARVLAGKEELIQELGVTDSADQTCLVLETDQRPPNGLVEQIAKDCGVSPGNLTLILTPTSSLAGAVQIVGRVVEVAMHKVHALEFPMGQVVDAAGSAPLPPPSPDFITGMGRTNDAILFDGEVHLFVNGPDDQARQLAKELPSSASRDYGRPFAEVFQAYNGDFSKIDPLLFSPARVTITNLESGQTFRGGEGNRNALNASFGEGA
ncbi:methenyltetrahydromethanopterin cyclohydrolase [Thiohalorhabdus methylotrophus]|uniref:Methenyltetrahydromethanopterin cyclohydrolase n=1 Tax=Thiohalorhabdus methylotrophus TaxID=3242694 RepID=A0ABV4TXA6_9GAMM